MFTGLLNNITDTHKITYYDIFSRIQSMKIERSFLQDQYITRILKCSEVYSTTSPIHIKSLIATFSSVTLVL